jgi:hypothetical protein
VYIWKDEKLCEQRRVVIPGDEKIGRGGAGVSEGTHLCAITPLGSASSSDSAHKGAFLRDIYRLEWPETDPDGSLPQWATFGA